MSSRILSAEERNESAALNGLAGKLQCGLNVAVGQPGKVQTDFSQQDASLQQFQDIGNHDSGAFEAGLTVADAGIQRDIVSPVSGADASHIYSIGLSPSAVKAPRGKRVLKTTAGRISVKATSDNGPVRPGYAAKAVTSGMVVGMALEGMKEGSSEGKVMTFVNLQNWVAPGEFESLREEIRSLRKTMRDGGR